MSFEKHRHLRWGHTTGSCAAAAARAAVILLLYDRKESQVKVPFPEGDYISIPVEHFSRQKSRVTAGVLKDSGDDPDVTHGITVCATVELKNDPGAISITAGEGVGWVTRPGLSVSPGEPAINPVPREMITDAVKELLPREKGVLVTLSIPEGEKIAEKTFNPRLGIQRGLSILGTTGRVRPMSREAYLDALIPQVNQALALGYRELLLTPGGKGASRAREIGIESERVVQTSNYVGEVLDACAQKGVEGVLLFGHLGKLVKLAAGIFHTHSHVADARRETLAAHAALDGASRETLACIMELNTLEASVSLLRREGLLTVYHRLAKAAAERCRQRAHYSMNIGVILYDLTGEMLGWNREGIEMGGRWGCRLPLK